MLTPQQYKQAELLVRRTKLAAAGRMSGDALSLFRGRGREFEEFRDYQNGDDVRDIDWRVSARHNKTYVRINRDEREHVVCLMVDVSASMKCGASITKFEVAKQLGAWASYVCLSGHDRVGLILFSNRIEAILPPKKGIDVFHDIVYAMTTCQPQHKGSSVKIALDYFLKLYPRRAFGIMISDFFVNEPVAQTVRMIRLKHALKLIQMTDPNDRAQPSRLRVNVLDAETAQVGSCSLTHLAQTQAQMNHVADDLRGCLVPVDITQPLSVHVLQTLFAG